jgi:DNA-binding MarR family transcriptional regulator
MPTPDLDLPTLTSLAGGALVREILGRMAAEGFEGLRPAHGYVIQQLVDSEPTITTLADTLGMTQQGASKHVRELETLGYVERVAVPGDARARRVRLTSRGRGALASGRRVRAALEQELVGRTSSRSVQTTRRTLAELLHLLGMDEQVRTRSVPLPEG